MKMIFIIIFCGLPLCYKVSFAQAYLKLTDVPKEFKKKYFQEKHEYNPLHVGDMWQYYFKEDGIEQGEYATTRIVQDSIINGKKYFKKINWSYDRTPHQSNYISLERNDSIKDNSYMLDFEDVDDDGNTLNELPLDSLNLPNHSFYTSYKYSYPGSEFFYPGKRDVIIYDSTWVKVWDDTVICRTVEYLQLFLTEIIADKYGVIAFWTESPARYLTGAVIDGKHYGTIVSVDDDEELRIDDYRLENNYPNPFNPSTIISYYVPKTSNITLCLYDMLGRRVSILVSEEKQAGTYSVEFNAGNLANGVYFYSLMTDSKIITKNMLLLK